MKTRLFFIVLCLSVLSVRINAEVRMPGIFSDNMVLQQQTDAAIWGMAKPGSKVAVRAGWTSKVFSVRADADGRWKMTLPTPSAGGPYDIIVSDGEALTLHNVMIGEVWLCSGQSNMEMKMEGFLGQGVEGSAETIMTARRSTPIRMVTVKHTTSTKEEEDAAFFGWNENVPEAVAKCSAVAYYMGLMLNLSLDVPVGLIVAEWSGARIQDWMDERTWAQFADKDVSRKEGACKKFNGMIAPLIPFSIKGWVWYQGESNRGDEKLYPEMQAAYAGMMRDRWGNPGLPFYFVQIAPYHYEGDLSAFSMVGEAQAKSLALIPHSGMVTTLDVGDVNCIHPAKKKEVGYRLAYLALEKDYGIKGIKADAPVLESITFEHGGSAELVFNSGELCLDPLREPITGFEMAGDDHVFYQAYANVLSDSKAVRNHVRVCCPKVTDPVAVRYSFRVDWLGNLTNNFGIPVGPFRTDDWDDFKTVR